MSNGQPQQLRETMRVYLIRTQVEEAVTEDKQASLTQRLTMIGNTFDALIQYTQSLKVVSCLTVDRVLDASHALLALCPVSGANRTDEDFLLCRRQVAIEAEKRMSSLRELIECCSGNVVPPENTCTLLDSHMDRRRDFLVASANFENLLENPRLSVSRMEKLHRQHNAILEDLRQSRRLLDAELPSIINLYVTSERQVEHSSKCTLYKIGDCSLCSRFSTSSRNCARTRVTACISWVCLN
ncbi:uncharacterized protein LOC116842420 [Odontomachus brunneus]|uniref:uncharacterized protein LOC116842420 n=1 Tax=Odontomachus brunneus TaxID=486640 RepID=UPI0013F277D5|nr:uncharacterized protein LOC116842420 [Odontomachus brunneus]